MSPQVLMGGEDGTFRFPTHHTPPTSAGAGNLIFRINRRNRCYSNDLWKLSEFDFLIKVRFPGMLDLENRLIAPGEEVARQP